MCSVTNGLYLAWSLLSLVIIIMIIVAVTINTEGTESNGIHEGTHGGREKRKKMNEYKRLTRESCDCTIHVCPSVRSYHQPVL